MKMHAGRAAFAAALLVASTMGHAAPILQKTAPGPVVDYIFGFGADFTVATGTGFADVTAPLFAVDLRIPSPGSGATTSGCEAADFAGFVPGSIALIQRGACSFADKAQYAEAAGAFGVLLFNEGDSTGREDAISVTLSPFAASTPVFFASFDVGSLLANGISNGLTNFTIRMKVTAEDLPVPEPGTLALLGLGLAGLAATRRRKR